MNEFIYCEFLFYIRAASPRESATGLIGPDARVVAATAALWLDGQETHS